MMVKKKEYKKRLAVSFSSGETSAFMAHWIKQNLFDQYDEIIYIMANTGDENEESLVFADKCDKHFGLDLIWVEAVTNMQRGEGVEAKKVTFETAARNGEPFEGMIKKYGIPNPSTPHCSRELKERTIKAYLRSIGWKGYYTAIGYRADEIDRINKHWEKKKHIYPLIQYHEMTKPDVNRFWVNMPFRLRLKGYEDNCKVCWKKSLRKLLTIAKHTPERFDLFRKLEKQYEKYIPESRKHNKKIVTPIRFYRGQLSVDDIIEMSKETFEEAPDDRQVYVEYKQTKLFGYDLDQSGGACGTESCEAFG